jgi:hypothetical protein
LLHYRPQLKIQAYGRWAALKFDDPLIKPASNETRKKELTQMMTEDEEN